MASTVDDITPKESMEKVFKNPEPYLDGDKVGELIEKTKEEYLPYIVNKFSHLKPSEIAVLDDDKFLNTFQHIYDSKNRLESKHSKLYHDTFAEFEGIFYALRKLLEILFQTAHIELGFHEYDETTKTHCIFGHSMKTSFAGMVMRFILSATDSSRVFAQRLCQEPGLLELFARLRKEIKEKPQAQEKSTEQLKLKTYPSSSDEVLMITLQIFHNCSIHGENRQRMLEAGCLDACLPYLDSQKVNINQLVALICVAYLTDEEQSSEIFKAKEGPIISLVMGLELAIIDRANNYLGWTAAELAKGLGALSRNDTNKKLIIDCGAIDVLLQGANLQDEPELQKETMEVLWLLSFNEDAKDVLTNQKAMELFEKIAASVPATVPATVAKRSPTVRDAVIGILWNIRDAEKHSPKKQPCKQRHIMISYQWDAQDLVLKVRDRLKAAGYKVWIDVDDMKGSIIEAIAEAVENSVVFLMCSSRRYKESYYGRTEAEYAFRRHKEIIPLRMEAKYEPDGWLGLLEGTKMYYRISTDAELETKMKELKKALGDKGKLPASEIQNDSERGEVRPLDEPDGKSLKNWNKTQVSEWMKRNRISGKKVCNLDGKQLHFLKQMLQTAPESYYSYVREHISDDISDLTALTNALEELPDVACSSKRCRLTTDD